MDTATQARIDDYMEVYERVNSVVKSAEVVARIIEQVGKDTRCEWMMAERGSAVNGNGEQPATEKQLGFLERLGVVVPADCSKKEASRLIDEAQSRAA